jgi:hypothetical protein
MASPASSGQSKSCDADALIKSFPIVSASSSTASTPNADVDPPAATAEPSNRSSKGPVIDKEGFITPYPIKQKQPPSKKKPYQPDSRVKFPPKPPQTATQPQPEGHSSASSKKGHRQSQRQRRVPEGEIRIGSLHSRTKPPTAGKSVTHGVDDGWIPVDSASKIALTTATNAGKAKKQTRKEPAPKPNITKKTRPVIVFDENNKLSWADEVVEEADWGETYAAAGAPAASAPSKQTPAQIHGNFNKGNDRNKSKTKPTKPTESVRAGPAERTSASSSKNDKDRDMDKDKHVLKQRKTRHNRNPPIACAGAGAGAGAGDRADAPHPASSRPLHSKDEDRGNSNLFSLLGRNVEC